MTDSEFDRYIRMYRKNVCAAALCSVRDPYDADDVTQDVFLKLYTYSGTFESDEHVKAWLIRCAVNRSRNLLSCRRRRQTVPLTDAEGISYRDSTAMSENSLLPILMKLGRNNRITLYMFYYEGYSTEEIARILHISVTAVTSRLKRGREQMKKLLTEESEDSDYGSQRIF